VTKDTPNRLEHALVDMFKVVEAAVDKGASIIILSDRDQKRRFYADANLACDIWSI
jgi:glutamate synthase (NADPH/NADH) large chain